MDLGKLEKILGNEPKYRLKQANDAVFKNFISDWSEATFFAKDLRDKLNRECPLKIEADVLVSKKVYPIKSAQKSVRTDTFLGDVPPSAEQFNRAGSIKARITLKDGQKIETVLMRHEDGRNTVCVSSQVGCPLGCLFCATGKMGFKKNLISDEIIEQVIFFDRYLKNDSLKSVRSDTFQGNEVESSKNQRVTNVTYMGMGEPFLNYDNVLKSIRILNDKEYFNIGARSISISTAGIIEGIKKLSQEGLQINLAISLHAPNDKLRRELMPIDKKYPLEAVLKAVDDYIAKTKRKVMFEYVLIKGVNDSDEQAMELARIMDKKLYFVNLILYNATGIFKASDTKRVEGFKKVLLREKINFSQRYRFGDDINAACGQFITNKQ